MRLLLLIFLVLKCNLVFSDGLSLLVQPDFFGENKLYLKNDGDKPFVVLTAKLAKSFDENSINFSVPYAFVKIDGKTVKLKQNLGQYFPVTINSGEIAFLYVTLPKDIAVVSYEIDEDFGKNHKTWYGKIVLDIKQ